MVNVVASLCGECQGESRKHKENNKRKPHSALQKTLKFYKHKSGGNSIALLKAKTKYFFVLLLYVKFEAANAKELQGHANSQFSPSSWNQLLIEEMNEIKANL